MKVRKYLFIILTLAWTITIFSFSMQTGENSDEMSIGFLHKVVKVIAPNLLDELEALPQEQLLTLNFMVRKAAHFTEYFLLGCLSMLTFIQLNIPRKKLWGMLYCIIIAGMDELLQLFVSGRAGRFTDVFIDSVGAACGVLLICSAYVIKCLITLKFFEKKL